MKYYIIAGEASGDLHGAELIKALKVLDPTAEVRAWGGDKMSDAGALIIKHYRDLAFMGFVEVAKNIGTILKNIRFCKNDIDRFGPDTLILVDYPGFNLRIAKWAKQAGYRVIYYISPQLWAWNTKRVEIIKKAVDKMFVILPFEEEFYRQHQYEVEYVGHPLVKVVDEFINQHSIQRDPNLVLLLPGSRKQEIKHMLPIYASAMSSFPKLRAVIGAAPHIEHDFYHSLYTDDHQIDIGTKSTYDLMQEASYAITTSGTATLECALFNLPQVVCYKGNRWSYMIAKRLVKVPFISLVNLIAGKKVVEELIQVQFNESGVQQALEDLLNPNTRKKILVDYSSIRAALSENDPPLKAAKSIIHYIQTN